MEAEFLRLLFYHAHREGEVFFQLTGQLAQPNRDYVFSKGTAFFNSLKSVKEQGRKYHGEGCGALGQPRSRLFCPLRTSPPCTQISRPSHPHLQIAKLSAWTSLRFEDLQHARVRSRKLILRVSCLFRK